MGQNIATGGPETGAAFIIPQPCAAFIIPQSCLEYALMAQHSGVTLESGTWWGLYPCSVRLLRSPLS
jgi:hypothetical protein